MKFLTNIAVLRSLSGGATLLAGILMLSACATQQFTSITPPPLKNLGPELQVAEVDVVELTPEMQAFLERYILKYSDKHTRLYLLMDSITSNGVLGFKYDADFTLTSTEAFRMHTGNCIGFANMIVVLAREAGIKARYQEVFRQPEWTSREATVLQIKHINVVLEIPGYTYVVDVSGLSINPYTRERLIDDTYAKALYWNNIGAEALLENNLRAAHAYLSKAIETDLRITDAWVNLGVVFNRNEQLDDAEFALQRALEIDPTEYSAMSNLYEVYLAQGNLEGAQNLQARVAKYRYANPYYLLMLSHEALEQEDFDESVSLLERAIRKQKNDHFLYFSLAKSQYLSGELEAAESSLLKARELAPVNMLAHYTRPLAQLVAEESAR